MIISSALPEERPQEGVSGGHRNPGTSIKFALHPVCLPSPSTSTTSLYPSLPLSPDACTHPWAHSVSAPRPFACQAASLGSVTLKCGPPEMGSVHYCCHRSGVSGVSSKTSSEWWVSLGASQPHRVPADHSRVWEKFPGCTCSSRR
ncbi:Pyrin [Manis pentadactyla]|nr:Pyrin [Manis pentadactyla]